MVVRPNYWRRMGRGWLAIGVVGLVCIGIAAISVFGFGAPVHERFSDKLISPADMAIRLSIMAVGFSFFAVVGYLVLVKTRQPNN
jgi:hypothetical protein